MSAVFALFTAPPGEHLLDLTKRSARSGCCRCFRLLIQGSGVFGQFWSTNDED